MARRRPASETSARRPSSRLATAGRVATRAGVALVVTALPLAVATFVAVVTGAPSIGTGVDAALGATGGTLDGGGGVAWLLHVGVLGLLTGVWLLGVGFVLDGLYG